MTEILSNITI